MKDACGGVNICIDFSSPELESAGIPLPEADGAISSGGGQVSPGAATERRKLQTEPTRST